MRTGLLAFLLLTAAQLMAATWVYAETQYISDELTVPLRRGPTNQHRILHAGLPSGTPLEVLGQEGDFTQVRTANGTEGYVPTQYLIPTPIAKDKLAASIKRTEALTAELATLRQSLKTEQGAKTDAASSARESEKQVRELQTDLAEIRRVSANSVALYEENKLLKSTNAELQDNVTKQAAEIKSLKSNEMRTWLLLGGGLVVVGLLFGVAIKSRPKTRSGW